MVVMSLALLLEVIYQITDGSSGVGHWRYFHSSSRGLSAWICTLYGVYVIVGRYVGRTHLNKSILLLPSAESRKEFCLRMFRTMRIIMQPAASALLEAYEYLPNSQSYRTTVHSHIPCVF